VRFAGRLSLIALAGVVIRVVYVVVRGDAEPGLDATWYFLEAGVLRHDHAFAEPQVFLVDRAATAAFPPLYPGLLALVQALFGDGIRTSQLAGAALGGVTIALTGVIGRRVADATTGLVAAAFAAVSPMLVAVDGSMMAETVFVPLVLGVVCASIAAQTTNRSGWWLLAGALAGLCALTRADGVLVVALVIVVALMSARRWRATAFVLVAAAVVIAPWVVRNAIRLDTPTIATVSSATALAGANCDAAYYGAATGAWEHACIREELRAGLDEREWTDRIRADAIDYATDHLGRVPVVAAARVARVWGLWAPADAVAREAEESRSERWQWLMTLTAPVILVAGVAGLWMLARRGAPIVPLAGVLVATTLAALFAYGNSRFRAMSEPILLIGAAVVLVDVVRSRSSRRRRTASRR
jgi:4-amino-4-deoxy-L-arabinose transferase-like glycosyltransferase